MDGTKKIAVAVLTVALVALGIAVAYGYYVNTTVPSNYGAYGSYGTYGSSTPNGYGAYGSAEPYGTYGPYGGYGSYGNAGPYGNSYGQWGGGMMGGHGMGMR
jgi:hypothetical protein